jgi:hypothetical protein
VHQVLNVLLCEYSAFSFIVVDVEKSIFTQELRFTFLQVQSVRQYAVTPKLNVFDDILYS